MLVRSRRVWPALVLVVALAALCSACDWTQFRFDPAHSGFNPAESTIGVANVGQLTPSWSVPLGGSPVAQHSSASVVNGDVYMGGDDGYLYVLNAVHGTVLWRGGPDTDFDFPGTDLSSPAIANGIVYAGTGGEDIALRAWDATGTTNCAGTPKVCSPLWTFLADGNLPGPPVVADGVVYVASQQGAFLYAIDAATGSELWRAYIGSGTNASPAVSGGKVFVGGRDHLLRAFDAAGSNGCGGVPKTCIPLWTATTGGAIDGSAAVVGGSVYVGSGDGRVYAFDAAGTRACSGNPTTCSPLWTAAIGSDVDSSPAVAAGGVYVGSDDKKLYAFDAAGQQMCSGTPTTCKPLWTALTGRAIESSPSVANGVVYIAADRLYAFDAAGVQQCSGVPKTCAPLLAASLGALYSLSSPTIANGRVYIGAGDMALHAYALP